MTVRLMASDTLGNITNLATIGIIGVGMLLVWKSGILQGLGNILTPGGGLATGGGSSGANFTDQGIIDTTPSGYNPQGGGTPSFIQPYDARDPFNFNALVDAAISLFKASTVTKTYSVNTSASSAAAFKSAYPQFSGGQSIAPSLQAYYPQFGSSSAITSQMSIAPVNVAKQLAKNTSTPLTRAYPQFR